MPRGGDALTYVGHATVLIELDGSRFLTDPLVRRGILHVRRRVPTPDVSELGALTAILVSHAHRDHLDRHSLELLAGDCPVTVPRGCAAVARRCGAREVIELDEGDSVELGNASIRAVPAVHDGRRYPFGPPLPSLGYLLNGSRRIYFAGDTDLFTGMSALSGLVDVALLPIWGWGPSLPSGHLDPARAAAAVARIRPRLAVPIHWGTLRSWGAQRGLDPVAPARAFAAAVNEAAPETAVHILRPGERLALSAFD